MENKFNIDEVNAWLKEEYGMSYDELSKEFDKAVDLLSKSMKQRKEMRDQINKTIELLQDFKSNSKDVENEWAMEICELSIRKLKEGSVENE